MRLAILAPLARTRCAQPPPPVSGRAAHSTRRGSCVRHGPAQSGGAAAQTRRLWRPAPACATGGHRRRARGAGEQGQECGGPGGVAGQGVWLSEAPARRGTPRERRPGARPNGPVHGQAHAGRPTSRRPWPPVCLWAPEAGKARAGTAGVARARPSRFFNSVLSPLLPGWPRRRRRRARPWTPSW